MKNTIYCPNCNSENDFHSLNCSSCGSLLRERVVNIDLWSTIWKVIETPSKAFAKIIYAENKNYVFFLAILFSIKLTFNSFFIKSLLGINIDYQNYSGVNFVIGLATFLILFILIALIQKLILKKFGIITRFKDNFAAFIYSCVPVLLALFIFFPVEYALFGKYWLFFNPSPYLIKPTAAYVFTGMEILIFIWMFVLFILLGFVQSKNKTYSFLFSTVVTAVIVIISLFIPYL